MITVGGTNLTKYPENCDWEWMGVAVLDLTDVAWGSVFDHDKAPYQVSPQISAIVGGGLDGGATELLPRSGWTSTLVANLFTGTTNQTAAYSPSSASGGNDATSSTAKSDNAKVGAIAGGVVGGFAVVVSLGVCIWWRNRRFKQDNPDSARDAEARRQKLAQQNHELAEYQKPHNYCPDTSIVSHEADGNPLSELDNNHPPVELGNFNSQWWEGTMSSVDSLDESPVAYGRDIADS